MIIISASQQNVVVFDHAPSPSSRMRLSSTGAKMVKLRWELPLLRCSIRQVQRRFPDAVLQPPAQSLLDREIIIHEHEHPSWDKLFDHQKLAVNFLVQSPTRGDLLALSPGLGKTLVSIVSAQVLGCQSILVVAPLTLLKNWEREIERWGSTISTIVRSTSSPIPDSGWVITNYDYLTRHEDLFKRKWDLVIFDESILIKNRSAQRSIASQAIARDAKRVWALSGSPISRAPDDLFNQFKTLIPSSFRSFWRFAEEYCIVEKTPWGTSILGGRPGLSLRDEFSDIMLVRDQSEVIDLPPEHHILLELELLPEQRRVHKKLVDDFLLELSGPEDIPIQTTMTQILKMLQVTSNLSTIQPENDISIKTNAIIDLLETNSLPLPTIIWTHWRQSAESLTSRLRSKFPSLSVAYLSSSLTPEERAKYVESFQSGSIQILVVSLGVGKFGLTLTSAQSVIYYDRSFDADALVQSSYRVKRIGLDHPVVVFTLKCLDSADEIVDMNLVGKLDDITSLTKAQLSALMSNLLTRQR